MKTKKEIAKELVDKMKLCLFSDGYYDAKQCAIIAIYFLIENDSKKSDQSRCYWNEVITEINNL